MRTGTNITLDTGGFLELDTFNRHRAKYLGQNTETDSYSFEYFTPRGECKIIISKELFESGSIFDLMKYQFKTLKTAPNQIQLEYCGILQNRRSAHF